MNHSFSSEHEEKLEFILNKEYKDTELSSLLEDIIHLGVPIMISDYEVCKSGNNSLYIDHPYAY